MNPCRIRRVPPHDLGVTPKAERHGPRLPSAFSAPNLSVCSNAAPMQEGNAETPTAEGKAERGSRIEARLAKATRVPSTICSPKLPLEVPESPVNVRFRMTDLPGEESLALDCTLYPLKLPRLWGMEPVRWEMPRHGGRELHFEHHVVAMHMQRFHRRRTFIVPPA